MMKPANPFSKFLMDKYKSNEAEREKRKRQEEVIKYKTERQKRDEEDRRVADASASDSTTTDQEPSGMTKGQKLLKLYETMGGDPFAFFKEPPAPVFQGRDLIGEIKEKNESLRRSGASQKMFPMYYEKMGAKQGKFVKAKCKLGKNKKTRIY